MAKCKECKYLSNYLDGEVEYRGTAAEWGCSNEITECRLGYNSKFNLNGDTDCKKFKVSERK